MSITYDAKRQRRAAQSSSVAIWALLLIWFAMTAGATGLLVAVYLPGHAGLTPALQALNDFLPNNPDAWVTAGAP